MTILPILTTSLIHFPLGRLEECTFFHLGVKGLRHKNVNHSPVKTEDPENDTLSGERPYIGSAAMGRFGFRLRFDCSSLFCFAVVVFIL